VSVSQGSLVLADITGYTAYLTGVELEHSHDVLADLLDTLVRQAEGVLTLAKLEGDAVFWYSSGAVDAQRLLPAIEAIYVAFHRRLRTIEFQTTCECNACRSIPGLDVKILAHAGGFVLREIAGSTELVGSDVIVAHRLLKNHVTERTGIRGYAMLTDALIASSGFDPGDLPIYEEEFEGVGVVRARIFDLEARWRDAQAQPVDYIDAGDAEYQLQAHIDGPPAAVWDYLTNPRKRPLWTKGVKRVDRDEPGQAPGIGTVNHCVHGAAASHEEILDWRPYDYYTWSTKMPFLKMRLMCELAATGDGGTDVTWRFVASDARTRFVVKAFVRSVLRDTAEGMRTIERLIAEERDPPSVAV
jgi:uncharacterized protein YndB with AHSA1/START domain